jgi:hypothetical protein
MSVAMQVKLGVPEIAGGVSGFKVVPNPVVGPASVEFDLASRQEAELAIIDVIGREIGIFNKWCLETGHHVIDISEQAGGLLPGVYFIRFRTERGAAYFKWIRQ